MPNIDPRSRCTAEKFLVLPLLFSEYCSVAALSCRFEFVVWCVCDGDGVCVCVCVCVVCVCACEVCVVCVVITLGQSNYRFDCFVVGLCQQFICKFSVDKIRVCIIKRLCMKIPFYQILYMFGIFGYHSIYVC